ncbi:MAG: bifunctional acetate--CoA ligase family protein/GNAT family N-acetyltransferase, partial [Akkermansiaceae bacterium]|nr:bifunctional acetate--CoA ligase family protein/GNAT family N-acetyltransferase [Armatimonadota bacterium]
LGSMLDVGWGDLLDYLGDDPNTTSIVIYMETVGDARGFLSAAREVALTKPILVIKAGRTDVGAKAAASHTGSLTGSDDVLDVAFDRVGVLRVDSIADVYALTEALAKQPRPKGKRLTIVTNAGGPGVLATDALISGGGELAPISDETMSALNGFLPTHWSHNNPVDVLGDAGAERYAKTLATAADDETSDGLLVVLTPQAMTAPTETAKLLSQYATSLGKPVLASWMGGVTVAAGEQILSEAGIPTFAYPDEAARVFNYLWRYADNLQSLYETPAGTKGESPAGANTAAEKLFDAVLAENRTLLTEYESKQLLTAYGIPTVETRVAATPDDAVREAESFGFPVVLKINSRTITHKTDVNGVQLNLKDADAVHDAFAAIGAGVAHAGHAASEFEGVTVQPMVKLSGYELILGASPDPQFGPVLLFGTGGQLVEVFGDRSLALPPLTTTLARRMMERTKIYTALLGVRGRPPVDMAALETILVRFAALITENPRIKEMDLNPLLVDHEKMIALDARVVLYDKSETVARPAIRPYPAQYAASLSLKDGMTIPVRPIRADDEPRLVAFHQTLSDHTVALRYFEPLALDTRTAHERLARIAGTDYDREITLIALDTAERIVAVARLSKAHGVTVSTDSEARFTLLVSDEYQYRGLGTALLKQLIQVAGAEGLARVVADILAENGAMRRVCEKLGFVVGEQHGVPPVVTATLAL